MRAGLLALALLVGCDSGTEPAPPTDPPQVTTLRLAYEVRAVEPRGALGADVIRYTGLNGGQGETTDRPLPWRLSFAIPKDEARLYELEAQVTAEGERNGIEARITVDGVVVSQQVLPGDPGGLIQTQTARASYRQRPD